MDLNTAPVVINSKKEHVSTIIWLHGLGADGNDFMGIVDQLGLPGNHAVRFIFPNAPFMPVTVNKGLKMRAWYDIYDLNILSGEDEVGVKGSEQSLMHMIQNEIAKGITSNRIILAGFSQGGAVAYHTALSYAKPLCGLMALSSYFATHKTLAPNPANASLAIAIFHGIYDGVVSETLANQALQVLRNKGYSPVYKSYLMEHEVCMEEVADISMWLQQRLTD